MSNFIKIGSCLVECEGILSIRYYPNLEYIQIKRYNGNSEDYKVKGKIHGGHTWKAIKEHFLEDNKKDRIR